VAEGKSLPPSVRNPEITKTRVVATCCSIVIVINYARSITHFEKTLFGKDDLTACYLLHPLRPILHCSAVFNPIGAVSFQLFQTHAPPPSMIDANASPSAGVSRILRTQRAVCQMLW
jgi:hypothetical protein